MKIHLIKLIDSHLINNKKVIVNCFAGVSRSATIVISYIMYKNKLSVQEAIEFVKTKRSIINPNYGFVCQLYNLQESIHNLDNNLIITNKNDYELRKDIEETYDKVPFIKEKFPKTIHFHFN